MTVRVLCDRCGRQVGELYGTADSPGSFWTPTLWGGLAHVGLAIRWQCSAGHEIQARGEKLTTAYRAVVPLPPKQRVVRLPRDLKPVAGR